MAYLYETHLHTCEGSACGRTTGADYPAVYKAKGYSGIFVTDHFFNGNCAVPRELPWEEKVDLYCLGYERAKEAGDKIGFDVFFGIEFNFAGDEFLLYGPDKAWLKANPNICGWSYHKLYEEVKKIGGIMVQAHPFRDRDYIQGIRLHPYHVDAVEGYNCHNSDFMNSYAYEFAVRNNIPMTSGTDIHWADDVNNKIGGVCFTKKLESSLDFAKRVKNAREAVAVMKGDKEAKDLMKLSEDNYGFITYENHTDCFEGEFENEFFIYDSNDEKHPITREESRAFIKS